MGVANLEKTHGGTVDKVSRYGWTIKDEPGEMRTLNKHAIVVDRAYQRDLNEAKVLDIAGEWSWIACGAIVVGDRNGTYYAIDGQHRLAAAMRRSDIKSLPCLIFRTEEVKAEARGFIDLNTKRKPISIHAKHRAMCAAGDEVALFVLEETNRLGVTVKPDKPGAGELDCVGWCLRAAQVDRAAFTTVLDLAAKLARADEAPITKKLLDGLMYLHKNCGDGLGDARLRSRIVKVGAVTLDTAARKAAMYFGEGGARIWAGGMLNEINKNVPHRLRFSIGE